MLKLSGSYIIAKMDFLAKIKNITLDILFPPLCLNCKANLVEIEKENKVCRKCIDSIKIHSAFFCPKCRNRVPDQNKTCHKDTKFLLAAVTDYQNPAIKNIIWFLKYNKWKGLASTAAPLINSYLDNLNQNFAEFIVMPIPLHKTKHSERGFNQSECVAAIISQKTGASLNTRNLKRIRSTQNQAEIKDTAKRIKNVENCFSLEKPDEIKNKNILLVDDVFTSGSTMMEAAKTLKQAGAGKIIAFVLARA